MRWEDERYVRVYTRDTGDWLTLSFEAQALFLMLLRKVDRIGELHLGRRGKLAVPGLVGHGRETRRLIPALEELLIDGCIRLDPEGAKLFVPNFLKAQEAAKSPTERKREQRERDAAQALEKTQLSRNVTPVTKCHPVPSRAVPSRAEPLKDLSADSPTPLELALEDLPPVTLPSDGEKVFEHWRTVMKKNAGAKYTGKRKANVEARLKDGYGVERLCRAVDGCAKTPHNMGQNAQGQRFDDLELICRNGSQVERFEQNADHPPIPGRAAGGRADIHKSPVRAEDMPQGSFSKTGSVDGF